MARVATTSSGSVVELVWGVPTERRSYEARVPAVPDRCMPEKTKGKELVTVFETDWTPVVQRDPALLERIVGPYWAVRATWELTDLEAQRLREMTYAG